MKGSTPADQARASIARVYFLPRLRRFRVPTAAGTKKVPPMSGRSAWASFQFDIETLSIVGWVAVWEMTNILLIKCQALQRSKWNMNKVIRSRIDFKR